MFDVEKKDLIILNLLQKNSKVSIKQIAEESESTTANVYSRIKHLESTGVIKKYVALLDAPKLNRSIVALMLCQLVLEAPQTKNNVLAEISKLPEAQNVYLVSMGDWDVLVKFKVNCLSALKECEDRMRSIGGVNAVSSYMVLEVAKETTELKIL
ncbi:Lrp/AsnC family transcriptional regulator [Candidatus Bathycorpusculum sp.]|uniref:Lrp/AsnC family transcriptional regulator n=1 Tax=Candidatus Bathycorpusculum sp. TaxID=2994959 RepID=UPI00282230AE|nr:Lrp/AsnC family transcriptional regulator [Candidatus Termitimicrobium sp.]